MFFCKSKIKEAEMLSTDASICSADQSKAECSLVDELRNKQRELELLEMNAKNDFIEDCDRVILFG